MRIRYSRQTVSGWSLCVAATSRGSGKLASTAARRCNSLINSHSTLRFRPTASGLPTATSKSSPAIRRAHDCTLLHSTMDDSIRRLICPPRSVPGAEASNGRRMAVRSVMQICVPISSTSGRSLLTAGHPNHRPTSNPISLTAMPCRATANRSPWRAGYKPVIWCSSKILGEAAKSDEYRHGPQICYNPSSCAAGPCDGRLTLSREEKRSHVRVVQAALYHNNLIARLTCLLPFQAHNDFVFYVETRRHSSY